MRAVVAERPGGPEVLALREVPTPAAREGWVLVRVKAFGLNRAELFTRRGESPGVVFPRVLGIECVGVVEEAPGTRFGKGQKVACLMGGMGRQLDGGYAEYTLVPERCVFAVETGLDWPTLGAIPEMFQTTYGSLTLGLELRAGDRLLVRGGTSSVGLLAARLARGMGATVLATTRSADRKAKLEASGVDHVIVDGGSITEEVHALVPGGVDRVLELVGTTTLLDSLRCARPGGVVCMTGILGGQWTLERFTPMGDIPNGVKLTSYSGDSTNLDARRLQAFVDEVAAGTQAIDVDRTFALDELPDAHRYMEANRATGKLVVVT